VKQSPQGFSLAVVALLALGGALNCSTPPKDDPIPIGLMLSYTGYLAANSINSERALLMAIEAANAAGGIEGRPVKVLARDTRSDPTKVVAPAKALIDAGVAVLIGPDYTDLVTQLRSVIQNRTVIFPSFATASDVEWKPPSWFVMGAGLKRVACEMVTQYRGAGFNDSEAIQIIDSSGYNSSLSFTLSNTYFIFKPPNLPSDYPSSVATVAPLVDVMSRSKAYVLAATPETASSLVYALTALGAIEDPSRFVLSPTLHTPAFLESIPKGALTGARGVSPGTVAGAGEFREAFRGRWHDVPLDDAYPFYDAGAIAVLAIQRALRDEGRIPEEPGLSKHIVAVTAPGGASVKWNELGRGLELLREGQEVGYFGLTGQLAFDNAGQTETASTKWWGITDDGFVDLPHTNTCE
jgi:ABC-type branched-subunit amino acid transport system substrate-binding protein